MEAGWLGDIIRNVFFFFDTIIYWLIGEIYNIFQFIASASLVNNDLMNTIMERVGLIIGLWMIFRLTFSLIQMLVSPDLISDKERGVGKLVTRIIISIVLLASVSTIFNLAYRVQNAVLESNVVAKVILGDGKTNVNAYTTLPVTIFHAFFTYDESSADFASIRQNVETEGDISLYSSILNEKDTQSTPHKYYVDYNFFISTLAGALVVWILLSYCLNLGIRVAKLAFLQIIAPIPILSYIKPKDESLQKWIKNCISTFLDVFIRLVIIFFAILLIDQLTDKGGIMYTGSSAPTGLTEGLVKVAIILGILMFAKQAPDLIKDIFPSMGNDYSVGFKNKINKSPLAAGAIGLAAGTLGGLGANAWAAMKNEDVGFIKGFGSTLAGGFSAGYRGMKAGLTSDGKGTLFGSAARGITASSQARNLRAKGYGISDKFKDKATDLAGIKFSTGTSSELKNRINLKEQELANARRNETTMSQALNQRISESGLKAAGLLNTFNGALKMDENGKPLLDEKGNVQYEKKDYATYASQIAEQWMLERNDGDGSYWQNMDENGRNETIKYVSSELGLAVSEEEFNALNSIYEGRNAADLEGRRLEKEINDIKDDMGKFKDRNKK